MLEAVLNSWDALTSESSKAYAAFVIDRDLGAQRSYARVARELRRSLTLINRWGAKYHWPSRARAYDEYLDDQRRTHMFQMQLEMVERQAKDAKFLQDIAMKAAKTLVIKRMSAMQIARLFELGAKLERECRGEPDNKQPAKIEVIFECPDDASENGVETSTAKNGSSIPRPRLLD